MPFAIEFNDTGLSEDTPDRDEFPDDEPFVWAAAAVASAEARFCMTT